jgi:SsrA-binding protein
LLLQKREIKKIESRLKEKGYTVVPLKIFFSSKGFAKVEIGLARGKKQADKRESLKKKQAEREMKRDLSD